MCLGTWEETGRQIDSNPLATGCETAVPVQICNAQAANDSALQQEICASQEKSGKRRKYPIFEVIKIPSKKFKTTKQSQMHKF